MADAPRRPNYDNPQAPIELSRDENRCRDESRFAANYRLRVRGRAVRNGGKPHTYRVRLWYLASGTRKYLVGIVSTVEKYTVDK